MVFFKKIVDWYIDSSLHVALAAYALIRLTFLWLNTSYDDSVAGFGFFGTIVAYNCIKYYRVISFDTKFYGFVCSITILSFFASIYYYIQLQIVSQIVICIAFLITLLYTFSFFGILKPARNWIGFKIFLVAVSWMLVTFWLPVVAIKSKLTLEIYLQGIQRFVLVYALMCVFEIVDLQFDAVSLKTLPQRIGVKRTKQLGFALLLFFLFVEVIIQKKVCLIDLLFVGSIAVFLFFSKRNSSKYYSNFWVESIPILWWLAYLVAIYF
jgi:hypothetical protein